MNRIVRILLAMVAVAALAVCAIGTAEGVISTKMVMRVSKLTQKAVVNVGEDLSLEIGIEGTTPDSYQWYFNGNPIKGADEKVYHIANAQMDASGVYRVDAFNADGTMIVSMDVNARVIDPNVPKSGDDSLPVGIAAAIFAMAAAALAITFRKRAKA